MAGVTVNVPVVCPPAIETIVYVKPETHIVTVAPLAGAAELRVTVPVAVLPGVTVDGLNAKDLMLITVKLAALTAVPLGVVTWIVPLEAPAGTTAVI